MPAPADPAPGSPPGPDPRSDPGADPLADPGAPGSALPQPASRHALSILRFPDPATHWVVVLVATLDEPVGDLTARVAALHREVPVLGARLDLTSGTEVWAPGAPPEPLLVAGEPLEQPALDKPFELGAEAPLRILVGGGGRRLALAGHHAAFDGLSLVAVLVSLLGGEVPAPVGSPPPGPAGSKLPLLKRLVRPADRVAPSSRRPRRDSFVTIEVAISGSQVTGRLAAACAAACAAHNRLHSRRFTRIGISVSKGGPAGVGNVASYRRIDLDPSADVTAAVTAALATPDEPAEQVSSPKAMKLLTPIVARFSDSFLMSNLGRHGVPGVERIDFFPVARGRSAVTFGSATVAGRQSTLTLRARDLDPIDARNLLHDAARRFAEG
ncbi:MAG: hypothetical protein HYX34_10690 [Actinobacteria bacterium]|nr:hypothetical protein [Actinomycetota bacterium]